MQKFNAFWNTTKGKFTISGVIGAATFIGICFICIFCRFLFWPRNDNEQIANTQIPVTNTPLPTFTDVIQSPSPTPILNQIVESTTAIVSPTATPTTIPPTSTPTLEPTTTPTNVSKPMVTASENDINIRLGPSTDYDIIDTLPIGESLEIVGRNSDSSWWQISTPNGVGWIFADAVTANHIDDSIPIVEAPPSPTPIPTEVPPSSTPVPTEVPPSPTSTPTEVPPPAPAPSGPVCDCSGDSLNCKNFDTQQSSQECFDYCISQGRGDIHRLDQNNDNIPCESLP